MVTEVISVLDELDLLEAHLAQHRPWGFRTVIVECPVTVTGIPKPLFFHENKSRFEKYDVEHHVMPAELFPVISTFPQLRETDWIRRCYMQERFDPKNPWVWHSDTDEILRTKPEMPEDAGYGYFNLKQYSGQVNRRVGESVECYRIVRRELSAQRIRDVKSNKNRVLVSRGWHFNNCLSTPESWRLKAMCRPWYFGVDHPEKVPSVEYFASLMGKNIDAITGKPHANSWIVPATELPVWMQENLSKLPVAETS